MSGNTFRLSKRETAKTAAKLIHFGKPAATRGAVETVPDSRLLEFPSRHVCDDRAASSLLTQAKANGAGFGLIFVFI